ncbi:hypothetical protein VE00_02391 [Pseudogymnoascus sp. WSF 3629]|nr:hypothetical protein VE00_02391 [Pseudogymnoascus sp. WSF 3629]
MAPTSRSEHEIQLSKNAKVARNQQAIYEKGTTGIAKEKARIDCLMSLVALISMIIAVIVFLVYLFIYGFHFSSEKCPSTLPIPAPLVSPPSPEWIMFQLADNVYHKDPEEPERKN